MEYYDELRYDSQTRSAAARPFNPTSPVIVHHDMKLANSRDSKHGQIRMTDTHSVLGGRTRQSSRSTGLQSKSNLAGRVFIYTWRPADVQLLKIGDFGRALQWDRNTANVQPTGDFRLDSGYRNVGSRGHQAPVSMPLIWKVTLLMNDRNNFRM